MRRIFFGIFTGLLLAATASAVPSQLTIQGHLGNGGASVEGQHTAVFKLFDALTEGNLLWAETDTIAVQSCLFTTLLGKNVPLPVSLFTGQTYWLETALDGTILSPRLPLTATTYSFRSQRADTADVALAGTSGIGAWQGDGTNVYRSTGNVGIGTSSLSELLTLSDSPTTNSFITLRQHGDFSDHRTGIGLKTYDSNSSSSPFHSWYMQASNNYPGLGKGLVIGEYNDLNGDDNACNDPNELCFVHRFYVQDGTGNVGVGTTTPTVKLDVLGSASATGGYFLGPDHSLKNDAPWYGMGYSSLVLPGGEGGPAVQLAGYNGLQLQTHAGFLSMQGNGLTGVNTTAPTTTFDVNGGLRVGLLGVTSGDNSALVQVVAHWPQILLRDLDNNVNQTIGVNGYGLTLNYDGGPALTVARGSGDVSIGHNLTVTGTKCRAVEGTEYGTLYYNAVESGSAVFTTSGVATLEHGRAHVELDPRWLAGVTVDGRHPLQVTSIVFHGPSGPWYVTRRTTGFDVIESTGADVEFFWTVQASQKGYEDRYLDQGSSLSAASSTAATRGNGGQR